MPASFTAEKSIDLPVPPARVWHALTAPELISQYMFGARVAGDWKPGGTITYSGDWEGTPYEDKGRIVEIDPPRRLAIDYYSALAGLPDVPESYQRITYALEPTASGTHLTISQENNPTEDAATQAESNWSMTLDTLKAILTE